MGTPEPCHDHCQPREDRPRQGTGRPAGVEGAGEGQGRPAGPQSITFRVEGMAPAPQGSKRHVGKGVMVESCRNVKPWRLLVAQSALAAGVPLLRGPVRLSLVFVFPRPAGHFRKDGILKPSAPAHHAVKPDGSKLQRSTEDALSKLVIEDDARIVGTTWEKRYCVGPERPGALITVIQLGL
jgi:crossover junction endodeoxyribonuclease RusA